MVQALQPCKLGSPIADEHDGPSCLDYRFGSAPRFVRWRKALNFLPGPAEKLGRGLIGPESTGATLARSGWVSACA